VTTASGEPCEAEEGEGGEPCQYDIFAIRDQFANQLPPVPDEQIDIRMRRNNYRVSGGFRNFQSAIPQADFYVILPIISTRKSKPLTALTK
jgi:hypothetical protein